MKAFFLELFEYNHVFNQKLLAVITVHRDKVSETLIKLFSHTMNAHAIWNSRIISEYINYKPWDIHSLNLLKLMDEENYKSSLNILNLYELDYQVQYRLGSGKNCSNNVRDLLFHIINHSTYHRGQIATELRHCHIDPELTDWIIYKMN